MNIGSLHVRVARKTLEALDIYTFELVDIDGEDAASEKINQL